MPIKLKCNELKDLYIAKSFEDLIRKADETTININKTSNTKGLIQSAIRVYEEGKRSQLSGDEERSYILFYRFFESFQLIKKGNDYKKDEKYYSNLIGLAKVKEVIECMELLSNSLTKRYSTLKESQELRAKEILESSLVSNDMNSNKLKTNSIDSTKPETNDLSDGSYPLIDCQTLVEILETATEMTQILIFDTRTAEDYNQSHIEKLKTTAEITIANIPPNELTPGLTASKLETLLPFGNTKDAFNRRRRMNKVVIIDLCSHEVIASTPAFNLAEALWKWDVSAVKVKMKPFVLRGGFAEWVITYPMFTSNPKYVLESNKISLNRKQIDLKFAYEWSDEENTPKKGDKPLVNGITNGDMSDGSQMDISEEPKSLNTIFHPRPTNTAIPGTALPLIPDRSTKPKIETNVSTQKTTEVKEDYEKVKYRKQTEAMEQMMSSLRDGYDRDIQTFNKDLQTKDEENNKLKSTLRQLLPEKPSNVTSKETTDKSVDKPVITINKDINSSDKRNGFYLNESGDESDEKVDNKEKNEFHIRNSVSINGDISHKTPNQSLSAPKGIIKSANNLSVNSNLSRSLSSPNIAQLLAKELNDRHLEDMNITELKERSLTNPSHPQFDRTLKPASNREKYNFQESTIVDNKLRDFCPVHSAGPSITGLRNLGNTCFMNAVIQCLLNTTDFSWFLTSNKYQINKNSKFGSNGDLVLELTALFRQMVYPSSYKSLSPKDFKQAVGKHIQGFIGCAQQDSHEFLVKLLEKLHEDLNESTARDVIDTTVSEELSLTLAAHKFWKEHQNKNKSIITQLFEGLIVNTLTCLTCRKTSNTFEVFSCLSLPLNNHRTTLNECLNQYFKPERLSGEAAWMCPTCKQKREADKKVNVWKLPKVLIVHLKRFSYEGVWRQKLQTFVEFPIDDLLMRSLNATESHYSLYGVVNHYGTLEGGHYTAYSHNPNQYKWHRFDDQEISQLNTCDVKTQAAYVLFYKCW